MDSAVSVKNVTKRFGKLTAVSNLSLGIREGELYGFIGPNGSGKTTTIKMMTGLYRPNEGTVLIRGNDLEKEPEKAKALFGYIPDEPFVYERMTGREFLYLAGRLYGLSQDYITKRLEELKNLFPLEGVLDDYAENYSRGNKQKLTILAALIHRPKILIIDEPIVGLDPESTLVAKNLFHAFVQNGGTIFVATHTLSFIQDIASRIGILKNGELLEEGTIDELKTKAQSRSQSLEELYLKLVK